ncbi:sigma-70 family RNA polymerase sigma factor [Liquorilactobacillus capillatus]|uniref:Resolvase HTH domain-containing protein n=1 Tax=Liquorilactobacillus capillatus DSM 19910 TaxID=1423731 RepID=A0A0R1MBX8_9LACO|nr:sigma-70 family RNA polymerase sigma factor [Liquorilactobacillus capillatus]KRL02610.1 hypothetical protein FC81_GL000647 [Liquorilactobacillus capillatus DSM 19910]
MTREEAFRFLFSEERERLIYGVCKRLHLSPQNPQYQDYLQEARIIFTDAYMAYKKLNPKMDDEKALMLFAYQRIYWRLLDMLRRERRNQVNCQNIEGVHNDESDTEVSLDLVDPTTYNLEDETLHFELYQRLLALCTPNEAKYLRESFLYVRPITQIAKMYGVSRQTIYKWRAGVQVKARILLAEEKPAA